MTQFTFTRTLKQHVDDWPGIANDPPRALADAPNHVPIALKLRLRSRAIVPLDLVKALDVPVALTTEDTGKISPTINVGNEDPSKYNTTLLKMWRRGLLDLSVFNGNVSLRMSTEGGRYFIEHQDEVLPAIITKDTKMREVK